MKNNKNNRKPNTGAWPCKPICDSLSPFKVRNEDMFENMVAVMI